MNILDFGQKVLDYFENTTNDGDTILFSIDSEIYEHEIFQNDENSKQEFERRIKDFVYNNGLDLSSVYTNKDLYAIALAAHQIILSYKYRDDDKAINHYLLSFYYPGEPNANILYTRYYGNNQYGKNYQEKLWLDVKSVLKNKLNRNLIIPDFTNTNGQRDQKYIKAQLCLLKNLKQYFYYIFFRYGFSTEIQYSKEEFLERIKIIDQKLNNKITNKMVDSLWVKLKTISQEDFGNFKLDDKLLFELLWTIYQSWDGTFPINALSSSYSYNPIYVELNDDDFTFNTEQGIYFRAMLLEPQNRICNFRFFTYIGDNIWEAKDSVITDLPESETFIILINSSEKKFFSKKMMVEYRPSNQLLQQLPQLNDFLILKYFALPKDFYDGFPYTNMENTNKRFVLCGGLKLTGRTYLDSTDKRLKPSVFTGHPKIEQIPDSGIINEIKISEYKTKDTNKLRLHFYSPKDNRDNYNFNKIYYDIPEIKISNNTNSKRENKSGVDITNYKFKAELTGLVSKGGFIPGSRIKVITDSGDIAIKEFDEFSDYNKSQLVNVKFGWFEKDDELFSPSESLTDRLKLVKTIEFKIRSNQKDEFQISEFWVTQLHNYFVSEYFGEDNYSFENIIETTTIDKIVTKKEPLTLSYISVNKNGYYEIKKRETPIYYDELKTFQKGLCIWLCHCGVATYPEIQNICSTLIQKTEFPDIYGENPEYQIFMPLMKIGIIIPLINNEKRTVYKVIQKYEEILFGTELVNQIDIQNNFVNLSSLLNKIDLFLPKQLTENNVFVRFSKLSWKWQSIRVSTRNLIFPCIYKIGLNPWEPMYFGTKNNHFQINNENPDTFSICKSIINREHYLEKNAATPPFEYFPEQKLLVCRYFSDIPSVYTRILMLADSKKITEEDIYLSGTSEYREQYFENIDYEFIKELDKKLSQ